MHVTAGIDLGGTAINYTLLGEDGTFLIEELFEHPARAQDGPDVCLAQIVDGLRRAAQAVRVPVHAIRAVGLDTPGPASRHGVLSARGSTNFVHPGWTGFDLRGRLSEALQIPVMYLNDGNAAALWGHYVLFGAGAPATSISVVIGTGLGGGIIVDGKVVTGTNGFGGELGHVLLPYHDIPGLDGLKPRCNCGRIGDLESLCSLTAIRETLLPHHLRRAPTHPLAGLAPASAATQVRALAEAGDVLCRSIFVVQAGALALFFDMMVNVFDPDALIVGGGALETEASFQRWFIDEVRAWMSSSREEQASIPIHVMPNGDTAGARGAAIAAAALLSEPAA